MKGAYARLQDCKVARFLRVTSKILCLIVNKNQKEPFSMYVALAELS